MSTDSSRNLVIDRGIPGCGKTTLASLLVDGVLASGREASMFAADDYPGLYSAGDDGSVTFHGGERNEDGLPMIALAHMECTRLAGEAMATGQALVVVHNTFTERWEFQDYLTLAEEHGYRVTVVSIFDGGCTDQELAERNSHGVPVEAIAQMRERYEHDWKVGDTRPPWARG